MNGADKFSEPQDEPLFMALPEKDAKLQAAHDRALETIPHFIEHVQRGGEIDCSAKLRFRDPDGSEALGADQFLYLWLGGIHYHPKERLFSGVFFEVPPELEKWHQVGQQLAFEPDDIFDWMALQDGHLYGGFTLRLAREKLPKTKRKSYDRYIGVSVYEPLPG